MIINLTPHQVNIHGTVDGVASVAQVPPSGDVARVAATFAAGPIVDHVQTFRRTFGAVTGLPPARDGVTLVVSALVAAACPRADVFSPGELIRDAAGQPIGCHGLVASI
jgi:hypothetical protein